MNKAMRDIEKDWNSSDCDHNIDIIGYSRGGAEAMQFANDLMTKHIHTSKGYDEMPIIRFVGLFDAVASFGFGAINAQGLELQFPNIGWDLDCPAIVQYLAHAKRGDDGRWFLKSMSPRADAERIFDNPKLTHGVMGSSPDVLNWIVSQARGQHVPV